MYRAQQSLGYPERQREPCEVGLLVTTHLLVVPQVVRQDHLVDESAELRIVRRDVRDDRLYSRPASTESDFAIEERPHLEVAFLGEEEDPILPQLRVDAEDLWTRGGGFIVLACAMNSVSTSPVHKVSIAAHPPRPNTRDTSCRRRSHRSRQPCRVPTSPAHVTLPRTAASQ